jgi:hypothetical protein
VIINRKKAGTAAKLAEMQEALSKLQAELETKQNASNAGTEARVRHNLSNLRCLKERSLKNM